MSPPDPPRALDVAASPAAAGEGPVCGLDEAGRGPVLGPLVVAGVLVDDEAPLASAGVRDSKDLPARERERLAAEVRDLARAVRVRRVTPAEVDEAVGASGLNRLEARVFGEVAGELAPARVVADACDTDAERFARRVGAAAGTGVPVVAEHGADAAHPVVSAASIVAKVVRDRAVDALAREVGRDVGSGYPSDPTTRRFLEGWVEEHGDLPPGTRRSWRTARDLVPRERRLPDFAEGDP